MDIRDITDSRVENFIYTGPSHNGSVTLNRNQKRQHERTHCCFCIKTTKFKKKQFIFGSLTSFGLFIILCTYTLIGSFIFVAIEGGDETITNLPNLETVQDSNKIIESYDIHSEFYFFGSRTKTVENIWNITVSLNILYRENWTRLAEIELYKFQQELIKNVTSRYSIVNNVNYKELPLQMFPDDEQGDYEWNLALAFFYSLSVLTTIGYGNIAPRTLLGKIVTVIYAIVGIPIILIYLSCVGSHLSKLARSVFTKALCCCLCSNCGYCCYDEKRMAEKERRMKLKRQQEEMANGQGDVKEKIDTNTKIADNKTEDTLSWQDTDSKVSMHGLTILAPALLCLSIMFVYVTIGSIILLKLDGVKVMDGLYFCFMLLSTIGFGDVMPGVRIHNYNGVKYYSIDTSTVWFCSCYSLAGLALTAMCFGVIHDEVIERYHNSQKEWSQKSNIVNNETQEPFFTIS